MLHHMSREREERKLGRLAPLEVGGVRDKGEGTKMSGAISVPL